MPLSGCRRAVVVVDRVVLGGLLSLRLLAGRRAGLPRGVVPPLLRPQRSMRFPAAVEAAEGVDVEGPEPEPLEDQVGADGAWETSFDMPVGGQGSVFVLGADGDRVAGAAHRGGLVREVAGGWGEGDTLSWEMLGFRVTVGGQAVTGGVLAGLFGCAMVAGERAWWVGLGGVEVVAAGRVASRGGRSAWAAGSGAARRRGRRGSPPPGEVADEDPQGHRPGG